MSKVLAIVGARDALADHLAAELAECAFFGACRRASTSGEELAALEGCDTLVYAAPAGVGLAGIPDLEAAARVCGHAAGAGVRHLVVVASAAVNEPHWHHPGMVSEARLSTRRVGNPVAAGWLELERLARGAVEGSGTILTVLRPAAVPIPGGEDFPSRYFARRLAVTPAGFDPTLQLLHPEDLAAAVRNAVEEGTNGFAGGTFNVAPAAPIPLRQALRTAGARRLPLPWSLQRLARKILAPLGLAAPAGQFEYVRHPWTVSGGAIRSELGFEPARTSAEAARALRPSARSAAPREFDDFGLDEEYAARLGSTLFRFLHDVYWRVEWRGLGNVPRSGRGVLTGVHRGHQPWDGVMAFHLLRRELGRYPRFLVHPTLVKFPFLTPYMTRLGGVLACRENADRVLQRDGLVGIYPEGIRGAFARYKNAYKLRKFGRDEFVKIALRNRAPIIPFVTVGSAEIFPILGKVNWSWWKRTTEWPCLPITPTMGLVPLPSKWHTQFLEPLRVEREYPPEAADDRAVVRSISLEVRRRMEAAIAEMLRRRRRIFWGSIFEDGEGAALEEKPA